MPRTLITQDEFEKNLLPNPRRLTMDLPYLAPMVIAVQAPKKKLNQIGLWGRDVVVPTPGQDFIQVGAHNLFSVPYRLLSVHLRLFQSLFKIKLNAQRLFM
jgi:hypothetical protein